MPNLYRCGWCLYNGSRILPEAQLLPQISFEEMLEMASLGAKVLQMRSVELASKHNMPIRVLSTFMTVQEPWSPLRIKSCKNV